MGKFAGAAIACYAKGVINCFDVFCEFDIVPAIEIVT
jgi:hypothetical protein